MWWLSLAIGLCAVASIVLAIRGSWLAARKVARAAVFTTLALLPVELGLLIYGFGQVATADSSSKATMLAKAISCGMNCSLPAFPGGVAAVVVWALSNKRLRAAAASTAA